MLNFPKHISPFSTPANISHMTTNITYMTTNISHMPIYHIKSHIGGHQYLREKTKGNSILSGKETNFLHILNSNRQFYLLISFLVQTLTDCAMGSSLWSMEFLSDHSTSNRLQSKVVSISEKKEAFLNRLKTLNLNLK